MGLGDQLYAGDDMNDELARTRAQLELARDALEQQRQATLAEMTARINRESQLGQAHAELTRLEEALVYVGKAVSIRSARKRIAAALAERGK
jgi:hypothetical protein